jgi:hypothetical protein
MIRNDEDEARDSNTCPACQKYKGRGVLVCWTCYKMPGGLKYFRGSLKTWLACWEALRASSAYQPGKHRAFGPERGTR